MAASGLAGHNSPEGQLVESDVVQRGGDLPPQPNLLESHKPDLLPLTDLPILKEPKPIVSTEIDDIDEDYAEYCSDDYFEDDLEEEAGAGEGDAPGAVAAAAGRSDVVIPAEISPAETHRNAIAPARDAAPAPSSSPPIDSPESISPGSAPVQFISNSAIDALQAKNSAQIAALEKSAAKLERLCNLASEMTVSDLSQGSPNGAPTMGTALHSDILPTIIEKIPEASAPLVMKIRPATDALVKIVTDSASNGYVGIQFLPS